jgi:hypothetical protein
MIGSPDMSDFVEQIDRLYRAIGRSGLPYSRTLNLLMGVITRFRIELPRDTLETAIRSKESTQPLGPIIEFFLQFLPLYSKFLPASREVVDVFYGDVVFAGPVVQGGSAEAILKWACEIGVDDQRLASRIRNYARTYCNSNFPAVLRVCTALKISIPVLQYLKQQVVMKSEMPMNEMIALALEVDSTAPLAANIGNDLRSLADRLDVNEENRGKLKARAGVRSPSPWGTSFAYSFMTSR